MKAPCCRIQIAALVLVTALGACADDTQGAQTVYADLSDGASPSRSAQIGGEAERDAMVTAARADLALREGFDAKDIKVVAVERVTWPNEARGCPKTEKSYEPGSLPGYKITLGHGDREFRYHVADGDPEPFLCMYLD